MHNKPRKCGRPFPSVKSKRAKQPIRIDSGYINHHPLAIKIWHEFNGNVYREGVNYRIMLKSGKTYGVSTSEVVIPHPENQAFIVTSYPIINKNDVFEVPFEEVTRVAIDSVVPGHKVTNMPETLIGAKGILIALLAGDKFIYVPNEIPEGEQKFMHRWIKEMGLD